MTVNQAATLETPGSASPPALREYPSKLFVETTTRCNLNCFMCVKQTQRGGLAEGDLSMQTFEAMEEAFPTLDALILNGIGEPLLHPKLEEFIRRAKRLMPAQGWVGFQSNGALLSKARALALVEEGLDRISLSMDAVSADTFRKVREGGELAGIDAALQALSEAGEKSGRADLQVGVEFVLMADNLHELPAALAWAAKRGVTFAIVSHLLPYDERHAQQAVYDTCSDAALELFETWKKRAEAEGVDLLRYFRVLWTYAKSPQEKQIVKLVEAMKAEADQKGIYLDLRKLFAIDHRRREAVSAVFEEARRVAQETGLDLRLPEVVPKEDRRCDFVEDGGAFVSWDGGVHPCYFLWHRYNCFANGWEQFVRPKEFGNLRDKGILDVWKGKDFAAFRQSVLGYDHSHCSSCSVAPCDYVQTEAFEQDCHVKAQPCGSCLWCKGLFQCLR